MADENKVIIRRFADGEDGLRGQALEIYRQYVPTLGAWGFGHLEMDFMSEVDNPVPDYSLRARYRKRLLNQDDLFMT